MKHQALFFSILIAATTAVASPSLVRALQVQVPTAGTHWIGVAQVSGVSRVVVVTVPSNGSACSWQHLTPAPHSGGLTADVLVDGVTGNDIMIIVNAAVSACGLTINSLSSYNGHSLDLFGYGGSDILVGGSGDTYLYGGNMEDYLQAARYPGARAYGEGGNDIVTGTGHSGQELYGQDGNDSLCADHTNSAAHVSTMSGGAGTDTSCGSASSRTGVEGTDCSWDVCYSLPF